MKKDTFNVRLVLFSKGAQAELPDYKVRQKKKGVAPRTPLSMFARSKTVVKHNEPDKHVTLTQLSKQGLDVVEGQLVPGTVRAYNSFDYKKVDKAHYDYSTKLTPKRLPLDDLKTYSVFEDDLQDPVALLKKAVKCKHSVKHLYTMYNKHLAKIAKAQSELEYLLEHDPKNKEIPHLVDTVKSKLTLQLRAKMIIVSHEFNSDGSKKADVGVTIPPIIIRNVNRTEQARKVPHYDEKIKDAVVTIKKSSTKEIVWQGESITLPANTTVTLKKDFLNISPLMVDEYVYDFFIDSNLVREFKRTLQQAKLSLSIF